MNAKKYFEKEYGKDHIKEVVEIKDIESLYYLIEEFSQFTANKILKEQQPETDELPF
jgi:hypothetical protein